MVGYLRLLLPLALLCVAQTLVAQVTAPIAAPSDERSGLFAITAARVYITPDRMLDNATVLVRDGRIVDVGVGLKIPVGTVTSIFPDATIVPAFIDLMSDYGQPAVARSERDRMRPQYLTATPGPFSWNEALRTEFDAASAFTPDAARAEALRALGYGAVLSHRPDGISRGSGAVISLDARPVQESLLRANAAHMMSFSKGSSAQMYPSSLMGMIALLRQTYLDADWYQRLGRAEERNLSLDAWTQLQNVPQLFVVGDKLDAARALRVGKEFDKNYIVIGAGDEYQRLDLFQGKQRFVVPVTFPDAYDVADPYDARMVDYADMLHWELADANATYLSKAGHQVALSLHGLGKDEKTFFERLERVRAAGLSEQELLRALTQTPATYLGMEAEIGTLEPKRVASFVVLDDWPVNKDSKVFETWVAGQRHVVNDPRAEVAAGDYRVVVGQQVFQLKVMPDNKGKIQRQGDTVKIDVKLSRELDRVSLHFAEDTTAAAPKLRLAGRIDGLDNWSGMGFDAAGRWLPWTATLDDSQPRPDTSKAKTRLTVKTLPQLPKPFNAFGTLVLPQGEAFVVRGATVWTNEEAGNLEEADVYVVRGKIAGVGKSLQVPAGVTVIDGKGKHMTCGIIDEHSHIAISRGVNEGSQESSAEVRIGDVINSEDVNLYRHLSGGVTAVQQLHGSANPIGGQSALIKLRWGQTPQQMKIEGADGFIKFALGENVKQSNWGSAFTTRYPQTRMGVEQVFDDYFTRAAAYAKTRQRNPSSRRDLDLEALAEVLNKQRFITCHSYKASEIDMLMQVAERHGFRVNTFTHILEGYKVADKMKAHGVGASTFSDWWAYKFEVWDAIPQNGPIMHDQGLLVAYNSDDAELGRRLNQDAAKAVQFGGLSEQEAWKFVTLNPAKLLHLDEQMGSIKVGKDADLVLWNDHPLSIYAAAEKTWVDGVLYFDREDMRRRQAQVEVERHRLAQAMIADKNAGKRTRPVEAKGGELDHCDAIHGAEAWVD